MVKDYSVKGHRNEKAIAFTDWIFDNHYSGGTFSWWLIGSDYPKPYNTLELYDIFEKEYDTEIIKRKKEKENLENALKEQRRKEYLKLKEEFEPKKITIPIRDWFDEDYHTG